MIDRHVIGGMVIALPLRMNTTALLFVTFASNRSAQPVRETVPCGKWGSVKLYLARRMRALGCDRRVISADEAAREIVAGLERGEFDYIERASIDHLERSIQVAQYRGNPGLVILGDSRTKHPSVGSPILANRFGTHFEQQIAYARRTNIANQTDSGAHRCSHTQNRSTGIGIRTGYESNHSTRILVIVLGWHAQQVETQVGVHGSTLPTRLV